MKILACLLVILCLVLVGCSSTDEVSDGSVEASVAVDTGTVDQTGEGTPEAGNPGDSEAEGSTPSEDSTTEDAAEPEVDAAGD